MVEKACAYNLEELATNQKIDEEISFTFYCLILFAFVFCVLPLTGIESRHANLKPKVERLSHIDTTV